MLVSSIGLRRWCPCLQLSNTFHMQRQLAQPHCPLAGPCTAQWQPSKKLAYNTWQLRVQMWMAKTTKAAPLCTLLLMKASWSMSSYWSVWGQAVPARTTCESTTAFRWCSHHCIDAFMQSPYIDSCTVTAWTKFCCMTDACKQFVKCKDLHRQRIHMCVWVQYWLMCLLYGVSTLW